jgi:hypothetical protein
MVVTSLKPWRHDSQPGVSGIPGAVQYPGELYSPSPRPYTGLSDVEYPFHDRTITVTQCGRICIGRRKINLSGVFAGQDVGILEASEKIWLVSFMQYDLGFFDHEAGRIECAESPFAAKHSLGGYL